MGSKNSKSILKVVNPEIINQSVNDNDKIVDMNSLESEKGHLSLTEILCLDYLQEIKAFLVNPQAITDKNSVKEQWELTVNLYLILKVPIMGLSILKQQYQLVSKYHQYNYSYNSYYKYSYQQTHRKLIGHPILLDILFSGCDLPYADSTFDYFDQQLEKDLKLCIKLFPNCLNSIYGQLRCRHEVTPFHVACINYHIPIKVVEYLIKQGADIHKPILINGYKANILEDLKDTCQDKNRFSLIENLIKKYSSES